ncbi:hypothetical protein [Brucella rhizosphaerae]|uniref:Uncharacterized protein n=1 Tax=Brucella rhizosphaerae TaxID=571254 RepID=A0A256FIK3_9HYPH|nr:hypothetical protein [Brucella rhizosphaerae]OYR14659.1 hypothetical protein CEV32_0666 [Brucella rhizosphaerae]
MKTITQCPDAWAQLSACLPIYVGRHALILSPSAALATETYDKPQHWHNYLDKFIGKFPFFKRQTTPHHDNQALD